MNTVNSTALAISAAAFLVIAALMLSHAAANDAMLQYVGECVHANASADHHQGDHREQWSAYSKKCTEQYNLTR